MAAEALGPDDAERQALLGGEQLGHDEHQPRGGQVDAGHVDDAGHTSAGTITRRIVVHRPAPSVDDALISSRGTARATSATIRML